MPQIEENIPLPANAKEAFPDLTPTEELNMRASLVKFFSDITGQPILPSKENTDEAKDLAQKMASDPKFRPEFSKYPNETLAMLAGMVAQMNVAIVDDLADLKLYVVNSLVKEIETAKDPKIRVSALSKLGEVDGVDAFKRRSEVTHKVQTIEEVEKELLNTLESLQSKVIDVEVREAATQIVQLEHNNDSSAATDA